LGQADILAQKLISAWENSFGPDVFSSLTPVCFVPHTEKGLANLPWPAQVVMEPLFQAQEIKEPLFVQ
jgi:hypothetical protein